MGRVLAVGVEVGMTVGRGSRRRVVVLWTVVAESRRREMWVMTRACACEGWNQ